MDIRHLKYFLEVVRCGSFTKAAETLHITQPTISKMIRGLEEELGVALLSRSGKQIEPTDAGLAIIDQARLIVHALDNLSAELEDTVQLRKGVIRIGLPPMAGASFFPRVIGDFRRTYPLIRIELSEEGAKTIERAVEQGSLDIGVVVMPTDEERFNAFPFVRENLRLLLHPGHRLAGRESVELAELAEERFILFRHDFALHGQITAACLQAGFEPQIVFESAQWDFISEMVASDFGIAMLPETICRQLDPHRVAVVPLTTPGIPWHLAMIWRKEAYLSFVVREWIDFARERLGAFGRRGSNSPASD